MVSTGSAVTCGPPMTVVVEGETLLASAARLAALRMVDVTAEMASTFRRVAAMRAAISGLEMPVAEQSAIEARWPWRRSTAASVSRPRLGSVEPKGASTP